MTVALLAKWGDQPPGTLYTSDSITEAAMVTARVATATLTGAVAWVRPGNSPGSQGEPFSRAESDAIRGVVSGAGITADDIGSAWTLAPALLSISATLTAGISTTVLLEVRDLLGTVSTAATIVADTLTTQTLRQAFLTREAVDYRFRRSSGTGTVVIYL